MTPHADEIADLLGLTRLEGEGGRFRRTFLDERSSAIYYLLSNDDASALHRLPTTEIWHHYAGAAVRLLVLTPDGDALEHRLGDDIMGGARPQAVVPGGAWQGAISVGDWTLLGTTMAPPFEPAAFELGDPVRLRSDYPAATPLIEAIAERSETS